jgi:putative heme-binding domain-containing protein
MHFVRLVALLSVCCALTEVAAEVAETRDATTPVAGMSDADIADGQRLFRTHCARCHGMLGEGGEGPSLKRAKLRHAPDNATLFDVINRGIFGTGMPGTFGPNDDELWRVAAYVRSLGELPAEVMPGDPLRGKTLYESKGTCATCHILQGIGRGVGPELTTVGLRRNVQYLRRALTNPDADYPMRSSRIRGRVNAFLTVRVVSQDGEFEGLRINEDEFSIQLRDLNGQIHSFDKRQLLNLEKAFGHSLMPGYNIVFTADEIDDLVSYLMTLTAQDTRI